jgi:hypothetical protein
VVAVWFRGSRRKFKKSVDTVCEVAILDINRETTMTTKWKLTLDNGTTIIANYSTKQKDWVASNGQTFTAMFGADKSKMIARLRAAL